MLLMHFNVMEVDYPGKILTFFSVISVSTSLLGLYIYKKLM